MEHKEEKTFNQNSKKKEEPPQNKDRLRSLWDKFKHNNIHIIGMLEREQKEQKIKKLFEKLMKENSPNLVKEIDIQVQEAQRVPNKMDLKRTTPKHIIITMPKVKDNKKNLKSSKRKAESYLQRNSHKTVS